MPAAMAIKLAALATLMLAAPLLVAACSFTGQAVVGDNLNPAVPPGALPSFNADGSYSLYGVSSHATCSSAQG